MRTLFAALALAVVTTGCVFVRVPVKGARAPVAAEPKKCPPGHVWSDGRCHDRGRGHDPERKGR